MSSNTSKEESRGGTQRSTRSNVDNTNGMDERPIGASADVHNISSDSRSSTSP